MSNKAKGILYVIIFLICLGSLGSCMGVESDYERAGNEFGTWVNEDPSGWSDTEREYFNDFMEWSSEN